MQLDNKYVYVELLRWSAYMRSLTSLKPCLLTFTDCLQVEYSWVIAQKGGCQKPLVKSCEKCIYLELWLQSKSEIHLGLTCLRFSRNYMQTNLTPKLVIPWMQTQGIQSWCVCTPDQRYVSAAFSFYYLWLGVASGREFSSIFCLLQFGK